MNDYFGSTDTPSRARSLTMLLRSLCAVRRVLGAPRGFGLKVSLPVGSHTHIAAAVCCVLLCVHAACLDVDEHMLNAQVVRACVSAIRGMLFVVVPLRRTCLGCACCSDAVWPVASCGIPCILNFPHRCGPECVCPFSCTRRSKTVTLSAVHVSRLG